ncbi:MAG: hypothetical protein H0U27_02870 [Nitrosopumilus sp.]|nr:hypothetical protein [Nitrosopumilus sp.]
MPGRKYNTNAYRYGLNGQEKDDEISGVEGAHTSAEFWEYDTRLGRRWNRDPIVKPGISSYSAFDNNPIYFADYNGLTAEKPKANEKGHEYDCGNGTTEVFDGEKYVPQKKSFNNGNGPISFEFKSISHKITNKIGQAQSAVQDKKNNNISIGAAFPKNSDDPKFAYPDDDVTIVPFIGDQIYKTTKITDWIRRITEPDHLTQFLFGNDGYFDEVGGTIFKQKVLPYQSGLYKEAPTYIDATGSKTIICWDAGRGTITVKSMLAVGIEISSLKKELAGGGNIPLSVPSIMGYSLSGGNVAAILKMTFQNSAGFGVFIQGIMNTTQSVEIDQQGIYEPSKTQGSFGLNGGVVMPF